MEVCQPRAKLDDKMSKAAPPSTSNIPDVIIESHRDTPEVSIKYLKGKLLGKVSYCMFSSLK
jgi:hypothetical protein